MNVFFNSNYLVRNYGVPCCNGQHFIKFINRNAVIPTWKFFQIVRHYEKNIEQLCGIACESEYLCRLHQKLNCLQFFSNNIRHKNIQNDIIISKIMIRDNCRHPYCLNIWCFKIYETEYWEIINHCRGDQDIFNCYYWLDFKNVALVFKLGSLISTCCSLKQQSVGVQSNL